MNTNEEEKLLVRLDERVSHLAEQLDKMEKRLGHDVEDLTQTLQDYLTRAEFWPWKALLTGLVALMLSGLVLAMLNKVIH